MSLDGASSSYVDVPLRWADMDAFGHVNNVAFVRLLEQARVQAFLEWFPGQGLPRRDGVVVARQEVEYLAPLTYRPQPVRVWMWVCRIFGSGVDLGCQLGDPTADHSRPYLRAETSLVAFDLQESVPRRLSDQERDVFTGLMGPPVPFRRPARQAGS